MKGDSGGAGTSRRGADPSLPVPGGARMKKANPNKLYYSISEVSEITGIKAHVLRYWETEFPSLKPRKNRAGNRNYRVKDIKTILAIRNLLYDEGYTISGARKKLKDGVPETTEAARGQMPLPFRGDDPRKVLREVRKELVAIHALLG
jgi:DNA-binding transcriptional MerR regulator